MGRSALLSADGSAAAGVAALASILGVHRNRIPEWRSAHGAPAGLELVAWQAWATQSMRPRLADRCAQALAAGHDLAQPADEPEDAPSAPPRTAEPDAGDWAARAARAKALRAELELAQLQGQVYDRAVVLRVVRTLGGLVLDALAAGVWPALLPEIAPLPADARLRLRTAHDTALLALRDRIAAAARTALADLDQANRK